MYHMPTLKPVSGKVNKITTNGKDQIRLTLGLVMGPGFPEMQRFPMTELYGESMALESRK